MTSEWVSQQRCQDKTRWKDNPESNSLRYVHRHWHTVQNCHCFLWELGTEGKSTKCLDFWSVTVCLQWFDFLITSLEQSSAYGEKNTPFHLVTAAVPPLKISGTLKSMSYKIILIMKLTQWKAEIFYFQSSCSTFFWNSGAWTNFWFWITDLIWVIAENV